MKSKVLLLFFSIFFSVLANSQTIILYHVHDGHYYFVTASEGITINGDDEVVLAGTVAEVEVGPPVGWQDPAPIAPPACDLEKAKDGPNQSTVCGPYTTRTDTSGRLIEGCGNTNNKACKISITGDGGVVVTTYTES